MSTRVLLHCAPILFASSIAHTPTIKAIIKRRQERKFGAAVVSRAPVFQKMDSAIHWINNHLADKYLGKQLRCYPLDKDLPTF